MAVNLSPIGGVAGQFFDNNGTPLTGGKLYTYAAGTTTNQATYTSSTGGTAHTNPIVLDSAGRVSSGEIWLTNGLSYKFVVKTSADVTIGTYDNVVGINSITADEIPYTPPFPASVTTTVENKLSEYVSVRDFGAVGDGVADDTAAIQAAFDASTALYFPDGTYKLTSLINVTSTIDVNMSSGAVTFVNPQYMPQLDTNPATRFGNNVTRYTLPQPDLSSGEYGFNLNALQLVTEVDNTDFPTTYTNAVAQYIVVEGADAISPRMWAINTLTNVHTNHDAASEAYGAEIDVNVDIGYSPEGQVAGMYFAGIGDLTGAARHGDAIWIRRTGNGAYKWKTGMFVEECQDAIFINGANVSRYAMIVYQSDASIKIVPATVTGAKNVFEVWNAADTVKSAYITDEGVAKTAGLAVGSTSFATAIANYYAPAVGSGIVPAQSSVTIPFSTVYGSTSHDFTKCVLTITAAMTGGLPSGMIVDCTVESASVAYVRFTNVTGSSIGNLGYDLRCTVTEFE